MTNKLIAQSPREWESAMRPVADVQVREVHGRRFSAELELLALPRTAFFRLKLPNSRVVVPGGDFVSVNMITDGLMRTASHRQERNWEVGTSHVVNHDVHRYDFSTDQSFEATCVCFQKPLLQEYARQFHQGEVLWKRDSSNLIVDSNAGACFSRYASFVWNELSMGSDLIRLPLAIKEIEESLWALLLSAIQSEDSISSKRNSRDCDTYVKRAEEFVLEHLQMPVLVAEIAESIGVSVPTLNRAFRKHHGIGPKTFLKRQRLQRVRSELLRANAEENSVTAVATKYLFWHLGQFASDYRRAFQESPSETLRRR